MLGLTRWNPFDEIFTFQREVDRLFNQIWSGLPARTGAAWGPSFQVQAGDEGWRIEVPMAGIDPQHVTLEVAGNTLSIRAAEPPSSGQGEPVSRFEQTITVPQFLDLEKVSASHRHGMLQLTLPLKESVKPRRIAIEASGEDQKRLTAAA
jgi:HSP20 family protein